MEVGARPSSDFTVDLDQTLDGGHKAMGGSHLVSQETQTACECLSFLRPHGSQTFRSYDQKLNYLNLNISKLLKTPELKASENLFLLVIAANIYTQNENGYILKLIKINSID